MKKLIRKYPVLILLKAFLIAFLKCLCIMGTILIFFIIVKISDAKWFADFENALDLKYNSPFIVYPLIISSILAIFLFIFGILLYSYKYKRAKIRSEFYNCFKEINKNEK